MTFEQELFFLSTVYTVVPLSVVAIETRTPPLTYKPTRGLALSDRLIARTISFTRNILMSYLYRASSRSTRQRSRCTRIFLASRKSLEALFAVLTTSNTVKSNAKAKDIIGVCPI